ncbi:hypothetical protein PIB30_056265 [Stylosanthes scabra]|uniref:Putative plant transposon protein domain-containing protein n=1 Tax=Stylosanthes scabra TaxID=79078 RepID=A0ABU6RJZ7_9FABA|nr:hypothetical protein [Stylosanthes scabra]
MASSSKKRKDQTSAHDYDAYHFRSFFHKKIFEKCVVSKPIKSEVSSDLSEDQFPEIAEQIAKRGWKRLSKSKEILKLRSDTPDARTGYESCREGDQSLDEVIRTLCVPTATCKLSANNRKPTQLKRHDLLPLARGWHEFIVHSIIPTCNKSEITVARVLLIHSIITGDDVRAEELIADNLTIIAESIERRNNLFFLVPSTVSARLQGYLVWISKETSPFP